jgi:hypothetical protein
MLKQLLRRFRPSSATVIASIALFVALGGTGYAVTRLPANSVGTVQLKNGAVISTKVRLHSLLAANFKAGQLPAGPQGPTGPAGPQGPAGPAGSAASKWALVRGDGGIVTQSGGITLAAHPSSGTYILNFGSAVAGKPLIASGAYASDPGDQRGETTAGPCGGGTEGRTCGVGFDDSNHVYIQTRNNDGFPSDHAFYVVVLG